MNSFFFFLRTLFKRKWWVLSTSVLAAILAVFFVSKIPDRFRSSTVIYTGIISGFDILSSKTTTNAVYINGTLDNLISIIKSQPTLESVSLKLLAMDLMNLDPDNDNEYLTARSSRDLLERESRLKFCNWWIWMIMKRRSKTFRNMPPATHTISYMV